jgi:hypothetical protein
MSARRVRGIIVLVVLALLALPVAAQAGTEDGFSQIGTPLSNGGECRIQDRLHNYWEPNGREIWNSGQIKCGAFFYAERNQIDTYFGYSLVNGYSTTYRSQWVGSPNSAGSIHVTVRETPPWWSGQWTGVQSFRIRLANTTFTASNRSYSSPGYYVWNIGPDRKVIEGEIWTRNTL